MKWTYLEDFPLSISWAGQGRGGEILLLKNLQDLSLCILSFYDDWKLQFLALKGHQYEVKGPQIIELTGTDSPIFFSYF